MYIHIQIYTDMVLLPAAVEAFHLTAFGELMNPWKVYDKRFGGHCDSNT